VSEMAPSILVACIGNIFQGDDAFGCEVANVLARRPATNDVRVVDFGIRGLDLTYALMDAPELTILVDTVSRGEAPGTLYTIEPDLDGLETAGQTNIDPHSMDPLRVLRTAKAMGGRLGRILLVGCEPADLGGEKGRMGMTPPVIAAIEQAATIVESLIRKEIHELQEVGK
jgi:hydrogenase maturation protease